MNLIDLRRYLTSWPYDAEENARIGRGADGREIILVRLPLGIEQYEVDGRPDGQRVHGMASALDFYEARINAAQQTGSANVFALSPGDCAEFYRETDAYLHRLNLFFRLKDWHRAERDATQILRRLDFVQQHARCAEDCVQLRLWRSHTLRIRDIVRAMLRLDKRPDPEAIPTAHDTVGVSTAVDAGRYYPGWPAESMFEGGPGAPVNRPVRNSHDESSFIQQDDYWAIRHQGHSAFLKSTRGLQYLAILLRCPEQEFHVRDLLANLAEPSARVAAVTMSAGRYENGNLRLAVGLDEGAPILDGRAKAEYQGRLSELRQELDESERYNDTDRAARAQEELNAIVHQLAVAVGLGSRDRKTSSEAERARSAITKRIKEAIQKIGQCIPPLGQHLATRVKTGYFCSYNPDPEYPVTWKH